MKALCILGVLGYLLLLAPAVQGGGKGTVVKLDDLTSEAPASWKAKDSKFKTRLYTFVLPKADGDERETELQIISFGKGSGGGMDENIKRWKGMFEAPKGK